MCRCALISLLLGLALAARGLRLRSLLDRRRTYTLQGQVLAVAANRLEATIKHEEIKGFMPAMTMPYKVKDAKALDGIAPGDLINATLVVVSNDAYLTAVKKVGQAPLEKPPATASADTPSASSGFELLKPGEAVPDARSSIRTERSATSPRSRDRRWSSRSSTRAARCRRSAR